MADIKTNQSKVYNALKGMGYSGIGASEQEFAAKMSNPRNRAKVYKALSERGYKGIGKDQAAFDTLIYRAPTTAEPQPSQTPAGKPAGTVAQHAQPQPTQQPAAQPQKVQQPNQTYKPTDMEMMGFGMTINSAQGAVDSANGSLDRTIQNQEAFRKQQPLGGGVAKSAPKFNAETGQMEQSYITSAGTEHTDKNQAEDIQRRLRDAAWREAHPLEAAERENAQDRRDIRMEEERLTEARRKSDEHDGEGWWETFKRNLGASLVTGMAPMGSNVDRDMVEAEMTRHGAYGAERQGIQKEQDMLLARRRLAEETQQLLADVRRDREIKGIGSGFLRAGGKVLETALNPRTWDFGEADMASQFAVADAVMKADSGLGLSSNEQKLLDTWAKNAAINSQFADQLSGWTKAGIVTGESLPFMLEMAMNPASGLGEAATAQLMKYSLKKYGTKWVKDHTKSMLAKKIATRLIGDVVGAGVMANTTGLARVAADAQSRMTGQVDIQLDANGDVIYKGVKDAESPGAAIFKAMASTSIENWSEMAGNYLGFINSFFGKALGKSVVGKAGRKMLAETGSIEGVSLNKAQKFIYELAAGKGIGAFNQGLAQFAKRTQWHGVIGEYLEEEIGNIANAAIVGDMTFDTKEGTGVFNLQQNIDTFCGVALMGGFMSALNTVGYVGHRINYDVDRVSNANAQLFGNDLWRRIRTTIDSSISDPRGLNDTLTDLVRGDGGMFDENGKKAILKYTQAALEKQGAEMAQYQPRMVSSTRQRVSDGQNPSAQWEVSSLDKNGDVIETQAFETEDEAKAYEGELKMKQQWQDYRDNLSMTNKLSYPEAAQAVDEFIRGLGDGFDYAETVAAINDPKSDLGKRFLQFKTEKILQKAEANRQAIEAFEEENGWTPGTVQWLSEQNPMQLDAEGLAMADQARGFLEGLAYPTGEVHVEHEQQVGADTAQAVVENVISTEEPIDPNNNAGQQLMDAYKASLDNMTALFDRNEEIKEEFYRLQGMGLSPQEIISSLDSFRPEEVQTIVDWYNANARYQSFMDEASRQIDRVAHSNRERRTFKGTINGSADNQNVIVISDGTNSYTLVSGNVTMDGGGRITGTDSGLIIGLDENGDFLQLGDGSGYSVVPGAMSLDQWEEMERERLQQQVSLVVDPAGAQAEQEGAAQPQGTEQAGAELDNAGGEAGAASSTRANDPSATAPVTPTTPINPPSPSGNAAGTPAVSIESVTDKDGIKRYENGVSAEDAVADMVASDDNPIEIADASIAEADAAIQKINDKPTKTRKDLQERKKHEATKKYYEDLKNRYFHEDRADGTSYTQIGDRAILTKDGKVVYDTAGILGPTFPGGGMDVVSTTPANGEENVNIEPEQPASGGNVVPSQAVGDTPAAKPQGTVSVEEQKQERIKALKAELGELFDDDFTKANDVNELVSMWIGRKRNLAWDDVNGKRGLQKELGWTRKIGGDTKYIETLLAKKGEGMGVDEFVHMVWESPENSVGEEKRWTTEEIKEALLDLLKSAQSKSHVVDYAVNTRERAARAALEEQQQMEQEAEESGEIIKEEPIEIDWSDMPFPATMTDEEVANDEFLKHFDENGNYIYTFYDTERELSEGSGLVYESEPRGIDREDSASRGIDTEPRLSVSPADEGNLSEGGFGASTEEEADSDAQFGNPMDVGERETAGTSEVQATVGESGRTKQSQGSPESAVDEYLKPRNEKEEQIIADVMAQLQQEIDAAIKARDKAASDLQKAQAKESDRATDMFSDDEAFQEPGQLFSFEDMGGTDRTQEGVNRRTAGERKTLEEAQKKLDKLQSEAERNSRIRGALDNERRQTSFTPEGETSGTVAGQPQSREEYLASHPLTEEQIMADTEATEDEKLNAIDFLRGEDDSAISRFYYDGIYERAQKKAEQESIDKPFTSLAEVKKFMGEIGYKGNLSRVLTSENGEKHIRYQTNGVVTPYIILGETTRRDIYKQFLIYGNVMDVNIPANIEAEYEREAADAKELRDTLYADDREAIKSMLTEAGIPFFDVIDSERGSRIVFTDKKNENGNYTDWTDVSDPEQAREDIDFIKAKAERYKADPMAAIEQAASSFREEQSRQSKREKMNETQEQRDERKRQNEADIADALKEFNDFLDGAKGSNVLDKFIRKGLEGNDKAQANLLDAFTLTNAEQRKFLGELLRLASKVGYAYIKSGVYDVQAWSSMMADGIGRKLKEVLGWEDDIIGEFVGEVWQQKYTVDGQRMRLSEHAERLKNGNSTDQTVNEHKNENNEPENVVSSQGETPLAKPAGTLTGDSAEFAERQQKIDELSKKIRAKLQGIANWGDQAKPLSAYKQIAKELGVENLSDTDLQELIETEIVNLAREIAKKGGLTDEKKFQKIVKLYEGQPSLNARDNDRINKQQYSTPAPMAYLMGRFVLPSEKRGAQGLKGLEPSAGNGMLTIGLPKEAMHVNDIDEMRLSNLAKQGFAVVTSQDGTQPFEQKAYDVVVTNPPFGSVPAKTYDGYTVTSLEQQMVLNALESMKDDGRAAIIIGGNTEYKPNGSISGKDKAFLNYLYSHYNVVDVINMDGKALYSRQGTGYDVRMILIKGRKQADNSFAPVKSKARAEQVKSYDELYKRVNDDILQNTVPSERQSGKRDLSSDNNRQESGESNEGSTSRSDNHADTQPVRGNGTEGSGQLAPAQNGGRGLQRPGRVDTQAESGTNTGGLGTVRGGTSENNSGQQVVQHAGQTSGADGGNRGRTDTNGLDRQSNTSRGGSRGSGNAQQDNGVRRGLGTEKVPYRQQSKNPFSLQSQMPAEQAEVVKKALEEIGDVDGYLVKELGYSSIEELHHALAAEQIDSVALAIHQMNQGNAFIIGDQTGVGKGRQGAALIRYGVKKGGNPVYVTQTKELFSDMYRDLADIGSGNLRPFIWSADDDAADITDSKGNVVYKRPSPKEQKRVTEYILKNGKLPPEYDYIITSYSMFSSGTMDYENGLKKARNFGKKSVSSRATNGQAKRDAFERLAENSYVLMDESHNAGGEDSAISGYLQYITTRAKGVTFLSATFAKRPGNMPIYSLKTAISKAGVKVDELIDAVKRGGATFQEIMSKALTEAGQMIRRERDMSGVTIDWRGIEDEEVVQRQREQYDTIIGLFNDIIDFQRRYVDPIVNKKNDEAAEEQGEVDHTPGTRDMGINNTPFASRTYNMVQQVLLSLKAEEAAKRAIEHLKQGRAPVIALANTNEGAADEVAGMGEDMEMPDLSINLKKGLQGTLRITKKDAFGNSTNEMIPFDELSEEGRARYQEIMDAIENASSGLSLSPIDVIKNELKKAGYRVDELTGRSKVFEYNEDGTVNRVTRKKDNKRTAAKFNNGELDALVINRSAGTGISLHASQKNPIEGQKQRVMIVVQAQPDVNQEVQMRGRIDRTGQVLRGMYEYVVSQIPSEQRLLMMLKAKLRSLDANTTSSQKSKFNEMQVQDIINKYGDDIVIQYLAEHPDLAAKMVDPLKWGEGFETMPAETLIANTTKDGEAGKTASKVLGRMALLKVAEQEKMLAEIGDMYQAEIDRLNEMGENDLEITEMPLRAKTLGKKVWEEGVEPGGKNPFADNSYVEEVEMDVLKKPMKAEEVKKSQTRLLGGKTWDEYKRGVMEKLDAWEAEKKKDATDTITARAEKKAQAEKEKYIKGAKKAQEKNGFSDSEIERNGVSQYATFYAQEMEKLDNALEAIEKQKQAFVDALETFTTDGVYALPTDIYDLGQLSFEPSFGKVIDIKISDNFSTAASTISFATLDGRRKVTIPISGMVKQSNGEKKDIKPIIVQQTAQARSGFFGSNVANMQKVLEQNVDNWDKLTSTATRKKGYIITGNLLKALTSLQKQHQGGKLISYTTDTGEIRQGVLMGDHFDPGALTSQNPISSAKEDLDDWGKGRKITSADGDVTIKADGYGSWISYTLKVPKSKKKGEKYFNDKVLLSLMDGQFEGSSALKADFKEENLDAVLKRLDELGVTVQSKNEDSPKRMITTEDPIEAIRQAADYWRKENAESSVSRKSREIADMLSELPKRFGLQGTAPTYIINSRDDLEALKGHVSRTVYNEIEELYNERDTGAAFIPRARMVVVFGEHLDDANEAEGAWWHEQTHGFWQSLPISLRRRYGNACLEYLRNRHKDIYNHIRREYPMSEWPEEACSFLIGNVVIERVGTERFLNDVFVGNEEIVNFATELRDYIKNGQQKGKEDDRSHQLRRTAGVQGRTEVHRTDSQGRERENSELRAEAESELSEDPIEAIEQSAKRWRIQRREAAEESEALKEYSGKEVYNQRVNTVAFVSSEAYQDSMIALKTAQNAIAHDKDVPDSQNAYMAENLMHGKNATEQEMFDSTVRAPLLEVVNRIMQKTGMSYDDIDKYTLTKSGLERNREFFVRDWLAAQRGKTTLHSYDELHPVAQGIYDVMADRIETDFEDGIIASEEEKQKKLEQAIQKAHQQWLDDIEREWNEQKSSLYADLMNEAITFADYLGELTNFILDNIDEEYNPSENDYSGFRAMFGDENGKYDEDAIIDELMDTEKEMGILSDILWSRINIASQYGLDRYRQAGMRSDEQLDKIEQMFHWYVPMRGFKEDTAEDMYQYFTSTGNDTMHLGGLIRHAKGRGSEAFSPIVSLINMSYKAITDCNQNMVNQKLYRLVQANPNDLIVLSDSWAELDQNTGEWEAAYPQIPEDATEEEVRREVMAFEEDMKQKALEGKAKKIKGKADFDYRPASKKTKAQHTVEVYLNGQRKLMTIVGNPRAAQALNGQTRFKADLIPYISDANTAIKNWMSKASTSYNPTFAARNMLRDWTHFRTILITREGTGYASAAGDYYKPTSMMSLFRKYRQGQLDERVEEERDFKDFMDNGGTTGFVHMMKIESLQKDMQKQIEKMQKKGVLNIGQSTLEEMLGAIEAANEAIENAARFATYRASRHYAGRTRARSAYDAKEVTANFNRRGAGIRTAGFKSTNKKVEAMAKAMGVTAQILGEGRMFFNATLQSVATIFKNFKNPDGSLNWKYIKRFATRYALSSFVVSNLVTAANMALIMLFGGDDGDDPYANLPEWVRRKNICLWLGWIPGIEKMLPKGAEYTKFFKDDFLTIPIGQSLAAFYSLGDLFAGLTYAPNLKPVDLDLYNEFVSFLNVFSPVDFETKITKKEGLQRVFPEIVGRVSSVLAPAVAISENVSWTGREIFRADKYEGDEDIPEYLMAYNSTNGGFVAITKWLNDINGDAVERGSIQVNPGQMQYFVEQYGGGPAKLAMNTGSFAHDIYEWMFDEGKDANFNVRKVEIAKAFVQQADENQKFYRTRAKYDKYRKEANILERKIKKYAEGSVENPEYLLRVNELTKGVDAARMVIINSVENDLRDLNKAIMSAKGDERKKLNDAYNKILSGVVAELDSVPNALKKQGQIE